METIIISSPEKIDKEEYFISLLFDQGLEYFHLRKPNWMKSQVVDLLNKIPSQYHNKIISHDNWDLMSDFDLGGIHIREKDKHLISTKNSNFHSIAVHNLQELYKIEKEFKYAFLSPVFNSISKENVKAAYDLDGLKVKFLKNKPEVPVYALGGIDLENILTAKEIGFDGVAILGFIWNLFKDKGLKEAILNFKKLQVLCQ
ncbi:MAG: hypothetical protein GQ564_14680 [Bacteroidales bacterium]|nr:hypothetical protein [Bacteroidales bacterium]